MTETLNEKIKKIVEAQKKVQQAAKATGKVLEAVKQSEAVGGKE